MPSLTPRINLLVLKSPDIDRAASFYRLLGLSFERHQHGSGPWHYAADLDGLVFEIYPGQPEGTLPAGTRLGFQVSDLDATLGDLRRHGVKVIQDKSPSPWGLRAVVEDYGGHRVELTQGATACSR
jgi:predicted enzyme related to lactoylglutathione lyase